MASPPSVVDRENNNNNDNSTTATAIGEGPPALTQGKTSSKTGIGDENEDDDSQMTTTMNKDDNLDRQFHSFPSIWCPKRN